MSWIFIPAYCFAISHDRIAWRPLLPADPDLPKGWVAVDPRCTLLQALAHPRYVVPGFPLFYVVSSRSKGFYAKFAERYKDDGLQVMKPALGLSAAARRH